jgi:hypothetical protein
VIAQAADPLSKSLPPFPQRRPIDFGDALRGQVRIDYWSYICIGLIDGPLRALYDALAVRNQAPEFDLRASTEALLPRTVFHLKREPEFVKPCMHRLVQDRRRDLGIREIGVHRERQLHQTRSLFLEIRAPAREALNYDVGEISLEMAEVVRDVTLDQRERSIETRQHVRGVDVGTLVVDDNGNASHIVPTDIMRRAHPRQQPKNCGEHDIKIAVWRSALFN